MSVEEARSAVLRDVSDYVNTYIDWVSEDSIKTDHRPGKVVHERLCDHLDRLVLEVQAEMPCSSMSHSMTCLDWLAESKKGLEYLEQPLCRSCKAGAELARQDKPHVPLGTRP